MSQLDETQDYFDDADLSAPEPLPVNQRYIGVVSSVDTSQAEVGKYRKIEGKLLAAFVKRGDSRTEAPQVSVNLTAIGVAGRPKGFPDDTNYLKSGKTDYFVGKPDKIGRHSLARLVLSASGKTEDEIKALPLLAAAKLLEKVYVTFEVTHTVGNTGAIFQNPVKIKAATATEVAMVV